MNHKIFLVTTLLLVLMQAACTTTHTVRTVGQGNFGVEASFGGPIFTNLGGPIPAPNLLVGGRYGVLDDFDVSAAYNLTGPIIPGIAMDLILAAHWVPIQPGLRSQSATPEQGWSLATAIQLHSLTDFETGFVAIPAIDLAVGYRYKWFNPFVGASLALHFFRPLGRRNVPMLSPYAGAEFILSKKAAISARVTFFDVAYNYWGSAVDWVYLKDDGKAHERKAIVGVGLGFSFDFLGPEEEPPPDEEQEGGEA